MSLGKILLGVGVALVAVLAGVGIYLSTLDFEDLKVAAAEAVKDATGRDLQIEGAIDLELSFTPRLRVDGVSLTNAPWGSRAEMVRVGTLDVVVALMPLLSGKVDVQRVAMRDVDILLETDAKGHGNWLFDTRDVEPREKSDDGDAVEGELPEVRDLHLRDVRLTHRDGVAKTERKLTIASLDLSAPSSDAPVKIALSGDLDGETLEVQASVPPLDELLEGEDSRPFTLRASGFGQSVDAKGNLRVNLTDDGFEGVSVSGLEMSSKGADVAGSLDVVMGKKRPKVTADLESKLVDLVVLTLPGDAAEASSSSGDPLDRPLDLSALDAVDAEVEWKIAELRTQKLPVTEIALQARLKDRVLTVAPSSALLSAGKVAFTSRIDASKQKAVIASKSTWKGGDVGLLAKSLAGTDLLSGTADAAADLNGTGTTPREIMASLAGHTALIMREGVIQNEYWELIAADLATQFLPSLGDEKEGALTCLVGRFDFTEGVGKASALLVESSRVTVAGEGTIDLGKQVLDLKIKPSPKNPSLVSLATPMLITGPFDDPSVAPDPLAVAGTVAKGAGALALGAAMPLALVVPFLSLGDADEPCPTAIAIAEGRPPPKAKTKSAPNSGSASEPAKSEPKTEPKSGGIGGFFKSLKEKVTE